MDLTIKMGSHGDGGNDNGSLIAFSQGPLGGSEQECHEGYHNGDDNICSPIWCREGYHSVEDDETGLCYLNDEECLDNMIFEEAKIEEGDFSDSCLVYKYDKYFS